MSGALPCTAAFLDTRFRDTLNTKLKDSAMAFLYDLLNHSFEADAEVEHESPAATSPAEEPPGPR